MNPQTHMRPVNFYSQTLARNSKLCFNTLLRWLSNTARCKTSQGWLAQLVERLPYKQDVGGSTPSSPTSFKDAVVAQLVRVSACHAEGRGFESRPPRQIKLPFKNSSLHSNNITSCLLLFLFFTIPLSPVRSIHTIIRTAFLSQYFQFHTCLT